MGSLAAWLSAETSSIEFPGRCRSGADSAVMHLVRTTVARRDCSCCVCEVPTQRRGMRCLDSFCISANGIPVSPRAWELSKFASVHYATPWIAVTGYSAHTGWDHPLYYDIITTGGLPYVLDLEICPRTPCMPCRSHCLRRYASRRCCQPRPTFVASTRAITTGPTATNESLPAHALPKESYKDRRSGSTGTEVRLSLRSGTAAETQQLVRLQRELYAHAAQHLTTAASARRLAERMLGEQQLDSFRPLRGGWRPRAVQAGGGGLYAAVAGGANASTARRAALASPKLRVLQLLAGSPSVQMTMLRYASWCCSCPTVAHSAVTVSVTVALPIPSHPRRVRGPWRRGGRAPR